MSSYSSGAGRIMGSNFMNFPTIMEHFPQVTRFLNDIPGRVPYSTEYLFERKETHLLSLGLPLSIEALFQKVRELKPKNQHTTASWYTQDVLAGESQLPEWWLINRSAFKTGSGLSMQTQIALLEGEGTKAYVPNIRQLVYAAVLYYWITPEAIALPFTDGVISSTLEGENYVGLRYVLEEPTSLDNGLTFSYHHKDGPLPYGIGSIETPEA